MLLAHDFIVTFLCNNIIGSTQKYFSTVHLQLETKIFRSRNLNSCTKQKQQTGSSQRFELNRFESDIICQVVVCRFI